MAIRIYNTYGQQIRYMSALYLDKYTRLRDSNRFTRTTVCLINFFLFHICCLDKKCVVTQNHLGTWTRAPPSLFAVKWDM